MGLMHTEPAAFALKRHAAGKGTDECTQLRANARQGTGCWPTMKPAHCMHHRTQKKPRRCWAVVWGRSAGVLCLAQSLLLTEPVEFNVDLTHHLAAVFHGKFEGLALTILRMENEALLYARFRTPADGIALVLGAVRPDFSGAGNTQFASGGKRNHDVALSRFLASLPARR